MLNIAKPHRNANENQIQSVQITNVGANVQKRGPSYTVGGTVNWSSHCGKQYEVSFKS